MDDLDEQNELYRLDKHSYTQVKLVGGGSVGGRCDIYEMNAILIESVFFFTKNLFLTKIVLRS